MHFGNNRITAAIVFPIGNFYFENTKNTINKMELCLSLMPAGFVKYTTFNAVRKNTELPHCLYFREKLPATDWRKRRTFDLNLSDWG
jgi:hypothetical protein